MKVSFSYNKEKDIWCLLNKGKSSNNSPHPTKQYETLSIKYGANPSEENVGTFIDRYIAENEIDISQSIKDFQNEWEIVSSEFQKRAEKIFNTTIPNDIVAYLTINSRCPYNIKENFFYVSLSSTKVRGTIMHELWHFYTWYGLGSDQEEKLGKQKYNDLKEALTVLLNVECKDLFTEDAIDTGYSKHQEIRVKILEYWKKDRNIKNLWNHLLT
ncbi:MAG: hypothetical protein WDZ80_07280 [Candidatus Paceibacterota bacterium]